MTWRRKLVARAALVAVFLGAATIVIDALRRPLRDRLPPQACGRVEYVVVGSGERKKAYVYWIHGGAVLPKVALGFFVGGLALQRHFCRVTTTLSARVWGMP